MARIRGFNGMFGQWTTPERETHDLRAKYAFGVARTSVAYKPSFSETQWFDKQFVLYRRDTEAPLAIVSDRYLPVLHADVIDQFDERFREQGAYFERRVGTSHQGAQMLVEYRFPDVKVAVRPNDKVLLTLLGGNSFDTSRSLHLQVGAFRLICMNGAMIGKVLAWIRKRHVASLNLSRIVADIGDAAEQFTNATGKWKEYADTPFSLLDAEALLRRVQVGGIVNLTDATVTKILHEFANPRWGEKDATLWGFYNAITAVASHDARGATPAFALLKSANDITDLGAGLLGR